MAREAQEEGQLQRVVRAEVVGRAGKVGNTGLATVVGLVVELEGKDRGRYIFFADIAGRQGVHRAIKVDRRGRRGLYLQGR